MKRFWLIAVIDREISISEHESYKKAWEEMLNELKECSDWEEEWSDIYEKENEDGFFEGNDFGISRFSAWANADCGDMNCDWMICDILTNTLVDTIKKLIKDNLDNEGMNSENPMDRNPYACGVHDGMLDVADTIGINIETELETNYYN